MLVEPLVVSSSDNGSDSISEDPSFESTDSLSLTLESESSLDSKSALDKSTLSLTISSLIESWSEIISWLSLMSLTSLADTEDIARISNDIINKSNVLFFVKIISPQYIKKDELI